jgi:hypothetical protein
VRRALDELGLHGAAGEVAVAGQTVTVTVSAGVDFLILPGGASVSASSSSTALHGVTTGAAP